MKRIVLILCFLGLQACNYHTVDNPIDKQEAEKITGNFYTSFLDKKIDNVLPLFDDLFFTNITKDKFVETLKENENKLGDLVSWELIHWETKSVSGLTNSQSQCLLVYKVKYEKYSSEETLSLKKENDTIKIVGYNVVSKGFQN